MSPLYIILVVYIAISFPIFYIVFNASQLVIDEEFHLRQGRHYCLGNFHIWDEKITTLPGLYVLSAIFLLPFKQCSTFALRLTSLICSIINLCLIFEIRRSLQQKVNLIKIAMETLTLSLLPPAYLFAHLYYTDITSITMILGMFLFNIKQRHNISALFGFASVLMRQTNIVWVGMILGTTIMDKLISQTLPFIKKDSEKRPTNSYSYNFQDIFSVFCFYSKRVYLVPKQIRLLFVHLIGYILTIAAFIAFILVNGSIVVGDKSAHEAAIHLPQIFYYSIFFAIFAPSITFKYMAPTLRILRRYWIFWILTAILSLIVIYANTNVHPYLLADNRHYLFYIWNKFYGRYYWFKYAMVPLYLISMTVLYQCISIRSAGFQILYTLCTIVSIALQQLIEIRYFILPFMIARLFASSVKFRFLILELLTYLIINSITFYLFSTKEIYWKDYDFIQRLIW
ncbi:putative Dol-P-Glc:Glc(2)Man(9)GlcNAc(2)-PP-Dol alpha-1,2-glucosyltransferase [Sitodiplosis mosellana]|uniref:putative Dol-P-Glc:Glc(2)Man(9)GlcNAc(2)-PP-Dol alpha-1,2-glucosyltransferase n=1 Tax=Sitodiplosis mosellana TaxID=263140 RepID=UPI002443A274|nr:putative Dol-P-Glc:Glc(2)Man(9)GlcNAc(2)-PP-Dol alpha-1,2-glucosyltransferase [Sitodiplosis mosellana]